MSKPLFLRCSVLSCSIALALAPALTSAAVPADLGVSGGDGQLRLDYIGDRSRIGIGVDHDGELSGELLHVFGEQEGSAWIAEGWLGSVGAGIKLNYHWLSNDQQRVYKLFGAIDQNDDEDRKATLGVGLERESYFAGGYLSHAMSSAREVGQFASKQHQVLNGTDAVGYWQQHQTTHTLVRRFAKPYDYGAGLRLGRFWERGLWRGQLGTDYEWGDYNSDQLTYSIGLEKFIAGTGHSFGLNVEHAEKSGDFEQERSDTRGLLTWRYAFGESYAAPRQAVRQISPIATSQPEESKPSYRVVKFNVDMNADAFFDFDSATLRGEQHGELQTLARELQNRSLVGKISLVGHTCDMGPLAYNQRLSERRASAVRSALIALGIPSEQILSEGRGKTQPRYPNDSPTNRSRNRRVDIHFLVADERREAVTPTPVVAHTEWRTEEVQQQPEAWVKRALVNPVAHKRRVDVYHYETTESSVETSAREYLNRLPLAEDVTATASRNGGSILIDLLASASDPDGDSLTILSVTQPSSGGSVENFGDIISFTPAPGFSGVSQFSYTVADGRGGQAEAQVRVSVVNDAPIAVDNHVTTSKDVAVLIDVLANDSDPNGDPLTLAAVTSPANGSATIEAGQVRYRPAPGFFGHDSFRYTVRDDQGASSSATVHVTVEEFANQAPVANDVVWITPYLSAITVNVLANDYDPDGDPLTVTRLDGLPPDSIGNYVINSNQTITFYPTGWDGLDITITYFISDGRGGTDSALLTIIDP